MFPGGVAAVIAFFFFVPGLVYELLVERRVPAKSGSAFKDARRVAVVSTPFSTAAVAIVVVVAWAVDRHWLRLLVEWLKSGRPKTPEAILVASVGAVAEIAVAVLLIGIFWKFLANRWYGTHHLRWESSWTEALGDPKDAEKKTIVTVTLKSGRCFRGKVHSYSIDREPANRELVLSEFCEVLPEGNTENPPEQGEFITMAGSMIELIQSTRQRNEDAEKSVRYRRLRRNRAHATNSNVSPEPPPAPLDRSAAEDNEIVAKT